MKMKNFRFFSLLVLLGLAIHLLSLPAFACRILSEDFKTFNDYELCMMASSETYRIHIMDLKKELASKEQECLSLVASSNDQQLCLEQAKNLFTKKSEEAMLKRNQTDQYCYDTYRKNSDYNTNPGNGSDPTEFCP